MDKRLQIDFSERAYKELVDLQKELDAPSKSEVIRNALGLLRWFVDEVKAGHQLVVERPDGTAREIVFHFLDRVKKRDDRRAHEVRERNA